jgi:hypothetical protein
MKASQRLEMIRRFACHWRRSLHLRRRRGREMKRDLTVHSSSAERGCGEVGEEERRERRAAEQSAKSCRLCLGMVVGVGILWVRRKARLNGVLGSKRKERPASQREVPEGNSG